LFRQIKVKFEDRKILFVTVMLNILSVLDEEEKYELF